MESMDCSSELAYEITAVALCIGNHWLAAGVWEPETLTGRSLDGNYLKSGDVLVGWLAETHHKYETSQPIRDLEDS